MPLEICPSLFHIVPDKKTIPYNENDIFRSDGFRVLQAETLTHIKEIIANTPTNQPLHVRLLCCYRMKDKEETYCQKRKIDNPDKQICSVESGIKTNYIHFHINTDDLHCNEYLLAFIEGADLYDETETLVEELFTSIVWLGITSPKVYLHVFTYGQPVFGTYNVNHVDEVINAEKKKKENKYQRIIKYEVINISMNCENRLTVSLQNNLLSFTPS